MNTNIAANLTKQNASLQQLEYKLIFLPAAPTYAYVRMCIYIIYGKLLKVTYPTYPKLAFLAKYNRVFYLFFGSLSQLEQ